MENKLPQVSITEIFYLLEKYEPKNILHIGGYLGGEGELYSKNGWDFTFVEPVPEYAEEIRKKGYKVIENAVGTPGKREFYVLGALSSLFEREIKKNDVSYKKYAEPASVKERKIEVDVVALKDIQKGFDTLVIDAEGAEWEILHTGDLNFRIIIVESAAPHKYLKEKKLRRVEAHILRNGYVKKEHYGINALYVKKDLSFNYNIMAHPKRKEFVKGLQKELKGAKVIWDNENNILETRKRCLEDHAKSGKDYGITIQDDAILVDGFQDKAEVFVKRMGGDKVCSFFFSKGWEWDGKEGADIGFIKKNSPWNEVALALPTREIERLLRKELKGNDDIGVLLRGIETYFPMPSLVDHRETRSLRQGNKVYEARAWCFEALPKKKKNGYNPKGKTKVKPLHNN